MTQMHKSKNGLAPAMRRAIVQIGEHVRLARVRRGLTQSDMAERMFVTRKTLSRLESGEEGVSLAVLASALWVLGLEGDLQHLADPASDLVGLHRERQRSPKRARRAEPDDALDF